MRNTVLLYIGLLVICAGFCHAEDDFTTQGPVLEDLTVPKNVVAVGKGTSQITVTWDEADVVPDEYDISVNGTLSETVPSGDLPYSKDVDVDKAGARYEVVVTATRGVEEGPPSEALYAVTEPKPPTGVSTSGSTTTSVNVTWTPPDPAESGFDKFFGEACETPDKCAVSEFASGVSSGDISGLTAGTSYTVKVWSQSLDVNSSKADSDQLQATIPNPPTIVNLSTIDTGSIQVEWTEPIEAGVYSYFHRACPEGGAAGACVENEFTQGPPVGTISDLTAGTLYTVTMWSQFEGLDSVETASQEQATMPEAPTNIEITDIVEDTMTITWDSPSASTEHKITITGQPCDPVDTQGGCVSSCDDEGNKVDEPVLGEAYTYLAEGLFAGRLYDVSIVAVANAVDSAPTTDSRRTVPKQPTAVTVDTITETTATITITPPYDDGDCAQSSEFKGYKVTGINNEITIDAIRSDPFDHPVTDLADGALFSYKVTTLSGDEESSELEGSFKTNLFSATDLELTPNQNTLQLAWTCEDCEDYDFQVNCTASEETPLSKIVKINPYAFENLVYGKEYTCTVESYRDGFVQNETVVPVKARLKPYTPTLTLVPNSTNTIFAEWSASEGEVSGYEIRYDDKKIENIGREETKILLKDLETNKVYDVELVVFSGVNETSVTQTSQTFSAKVDSLTPTIISDTQITVTWEHPRDNFEPLLSKYYIEVLDEGACVESFVLDNQDGTEGPFPVRIHCTGDPTEGDNFIIAGPVNLPVPSLVACNEYTFDVYPINTVATGIAAQTIGTTAVGKPKPDDSVNLQIEEPTSNSLTFTWNIDMEPMNCNKRTNITITYTECGTKDQKNIFINNHETGTFTQNDLLPYLDHIIKVEVFSVNSEGNEPSEGINDEETDKTAPGEPDAPTGMSQMHVTHNTATIIWDELDLCSVHGEPDSYTLTCSYTNPLDGIKVDLLPIEIGTDKTSHTLDAVQIYKNYTCDLNVKNTAGLTSNKDSTNFLTDEWIPSKLDVNQIRAEPSNAHIDLKWPPPEEPNGIINKSRICWYNIFTRSAEICSISDTPPDTDGLYSFTIPNLKAFNTYKYSVATCTKVNCSEPSDEKETSTTNGMADSTNVYAQPNGPHAINITWDPPQEETADVTDYRVLVYDDDDDDESDPLKCNLTNRGFNNNSVQCTGLEAWWGYRVQLEIITYKERDGEGKEMTNTDSNPAHTITGEAAPGPVQKVEYNIPDVKICRSVQVTVREPTPRDKNGNITEYTILPMYGDDSTPDESKKVTCKIADCAGSQFTKDVDVNPNEKNIRFQVRAHTLADEGEELASEVEPPRSLCSPEIPLNGGVDSLRVPEDQTSVDSTKQLKVSVNSTFFTDNSNGDITFTGIIVCDADLANDDTAVNNIQNKQDLDNKYKPWAERVDADQLGPYRATEDTWDPSQLVTGRQKRAVNPEYVIGADNSCDKNDANTYCNGPLKSGRSYKVRSVRCSAGGCMVSKYATGEPPQLGVPPDIGLIVGMTIFALLLVAVIVGALYMWRSKRWPFKESSSSNDRTTGYNGAHENPIFEPEGKPDVVNALYFPEYVKDLHKDSGLKFTEQYESIKTHCAKKSMDVSTEPENRAKNRYVNILPFDFSRVKLLPQDDVPGSDYINANYMPGYNGRREFIATQGPLVCTMNDFWRMVWEQNSHIIVMLTQLTQQGRSKCDQYWPKGNEPVYYGDLAVKTVSESVLGDYTIRILEVQLGSDKRTIKQFHMTSWPDFGCPDTTDILLNFTRVVRADVRPGAGPITVHCSAGVGRTGTYIAVDRLLQHIETHDDIDIYGITMEMRDYRSYMVQTEDQYIYIHDCLKDVLEARNKQEDEDENIYENTGQTPQVEEEENIYENSNHKGNVTTDPNGHHYDNHKKALHRMSSPP